MCSKVLFKSRWYLSWLSILAKTQEFILASEKISAIANEWPKGSNYQPTLGRASLPKFSRIYLLLITLNYLPMSIW